MSRKLLFLLPLVVIIGGLLVWAGFWLGNRHPANQNSNIAATSDNSSDQSSLAAPGGLSVENSSSGAANLGQLGTNSSSQSGVNGSTQSSVTGQSNNSSSSSSSGSSPTDPATFSQYNKYSSSSTALFGDIQVGTGATLSAGQTAVITYKGYLTNGTLFDESKTESNGQLQPLTFVLGQHQVILGMEEGVAGMKIGGTRLVIIPPALGYGAAGQGSIPANSVLVFVVDLLDAH